MRTASGTTAQAGLLLSALLLAACSETGQPATLPTPTPTASSTSATPTPTPTLQSPKEEVEAAVRTYYAELTKAAQTSDTSVLRTLSTKGCPCYRAVRVIDRFSTNGYTAPDASFLIKSLRVHSLDGGTALAEVRTDEPMYKVFDSSGVVIERIPARSKFLDLSMVRSPGGRWIVGNQFDLLGSS